MAGAAPTTHLEESLWDQGLELVAGIDEVGIGSICGPVVAAAVVIGPRVQPIAGVRDSKLLSAAQREELYPLIFSQAVAVAAGAASVAEIDRLNVRRASHLAMRRALARVGRFDHALVDGGPDQDRRVSTRDTPRLTVAVGAVVG